MATQTTGSLFKASNQVALKSKATQTTKSFPNPEFLYPIPMAL